MKYGGEVKKYPPVKRIEGVVVKDMKMYCDERGGLMEILRCDDDFFTKFGQIYVSITLPGVVKAWHYHEKQTDIIAVISGMSKMVLFDAREGSPTNGVINEFFLGEHNHTLITIPPGVIHGQKPYGPTPSYLLNLPTEPFYIDKPDEIRIDPFDNNIPYNWDLRQG